MEEPAGTLTDADRYVIYFPQPEISEEALKATREAVLSFVDKVFEGATFYKRVPYEAEGRYKGTNERTQALEILIEQLPDKDVRIEQLAWLILCYLDSSRGVGEEETVWYYQHPVTLHKLNNPDKRKPSQGGNR